MRWLVGWSSTAAGAGLPGAGDYGGPGAYAEYAEDAGRVGDDGETLHPVGSQLLWGDPDPLWAVGDWRPDEVRVVRADAQTRIAVLGTCGATDEQLRVGLFAARGGALRHLTAWPGSYTAIVQVGRRITVCGDLAGARPVFHTPWAGGTAYATAALPLADLIEANLDFGHLAALLAAPDVPAALYDSTPYDGVRRVPPGHALILRAGAREIAGYEPVASLAVAAPPADPDSAVDGVRDALVEAVRARLSAPRHVPDIDPGPVPGMGPAERRAARGMPVAGIGADLSGGPASGTLALLAAGLPGRPGTLLGHGTGAGERLLAVTFNDLAVGGHEAELERAGTLAANPRLHHVVVTGAEDTLPYADLDGPLTDEPGRSLVTAARHRARLAAGSADHFTGHGARQVLDAHPARLADLLMDRKRRHLVRPVAALTRADGSVLVPARVYGAARRLARTPYGAGVEGLAERLLHRRFDDLGGATGAVEASLAALVWGGPGPAARWLTGEALAEVSVRLQSAAHRTGVGPGQRPGDYRARAVLARHAADLRVLEQAAEIRSQRLHAPFLDNQVVRACRALPETLRVQPGARAAILRTVLKGSGVTDLPPGWGTPSQGSATAAARAGLRMATDPLLALFDAPLLAEAGLVEARVIRKALRGAAAGEPLPLDGLADLVSLELWLRRLLSRRGTCWTGTPARARAVPAGIAPRRRAVSSGG
ncbi:asparagine synthase-related protein [Streptomyces sp. A012304]|uniref:asparagine synthase-related protein n=1 Tax=Streptomyces sp. A012304 TaxID=375446 RepID=UPI0022306AFC|nr:asparagine synthase-related protein [Streptomyces sp. A012304]GKQ40337.1 asparagine synthase [Streptomyces sp. A012304]